MRSCIRTGLVMIAATLVLGACADAPTQPANDADEDGRRPATVLTSQNGRYVVWLRPGGGMTSAQAGDVTSITADVEAGGGAVVRDLRQIGFISVEGLSADAVAALAGRADVLGVAPDFEAQWIPPANQTMVSRVRMPARAVRSRGTNQTNAFFFADQWNMRQIRAPQSYGETPTGAGALVCVLDSGVDPGQLDLVGKVDLTKSVSFIATEPFIEDLNFHGTFVSALIASNGIGIASVAPDATLCAVKVLDFTGGGPVSGVLGGLVHAADVGADVANMSLGIYLPRGAPGVSVLIEAFREAVAYAREHGTQVVAAAGNDFADLDEDGDMIAIPAEIPGVISVAATAPFNQANFDALASYTNFGGSRGGVDLAAPGGDFLPGGVLEDLILSACSRFVCGADGVYVFGSGTSFAAPHVSGVGALAESRFPGNQSARALDTCILQNVTIIRKPNGALDRRYGAGRLDALGGGLCPRR